jgi:hypothetical protein
VVRGIGLDPLGMPGRKKPGPPPMMSRESSKMFGKPWACAWPAPASTITAARKAKARIILFLEKNQNMPAETGHNCGDRATNEAVTQTIFERRG